MGRPVCYRALAASGVEVTYMTDFDPQSSGVEVWQPFSATGRLPNQSPDMASAGEQMAGAIAVRFTLAPREKKVIPMALSWDLPVVQFGGGRKWVRHYAQFFDASGTNALKIARAALENNQGWGSQIDAWQKPYVEDESKPAWYRGELFNELYIIADGGTLWAHEQGGPANPLHLSAKNADSFAYLECFDYAYYGTSDVRFYGSFPLIKFWPEIEKQEMREYTDTIPESISQRYLWSWKLQHDHKFETMQRKVAGSAPHDLGSPTEDQPLTAWARTVRPCTKTSRSRKFGPAPLLPSPRLCCRRACATRHSTRRAAFTTLCGKIADIFSARRRPTTREAYTVPACI
jgi:non-lysosomal glucosylceramidase